MSHLSTKNLCKHFDGKGGRRATAVTDFSLDVEKGEFITLLGPSGCGKTTVLRMIAGLEHPNSGTIEIGGNDVTLLPPNKRETAMVFQHYALFPHMDIFHNVAFGLRFKKGPDPISQKVKNILKVVGMEDLAHRMPSELSGGQQQRVALARALVTEPKVLLCDEPLSNLDTELRLQMRKEIKRIHKEFNSTTIYVTHDQEEAMSLADRVVRMRNGRVESIITS